MNPCQDLQVHQPLVSVVIPAYNSADLTVETVESVLAQTYPNIEVTVVDDGSTDHTRDALEPFTNRIAYLYKENGGACSARNAGFRLSSGRYVAFLDCDDLWLPEKLERSVVALECNPDAGMVFTSCLVIDKSGDVTGEFTSAFDADRAHADLLEGNFVPAPTVVIRRSSMIEVGLFDEEIFVPADWDLWIRLSERYPVCYVPELLSKYRLASNYSLRHVELALVEIDYVLAKHTDVESHRGKRIRRRVLAQSCLDFAVSFRSVSDLQNARQMVTRALSLRPTNLRILAHYILSFLGIGIWKRASRQMIFRG